MFNIASLKAKTKIRKVLVRELLYVHDAALVSRTETGLKSLVNSFGLKISLTKTEGFGEINKSHI